MKEQSSKAQLVFLVIFLSKISNGSCQRKRDRQARGQKKSVRTQESQSNGDAEYVVVLSHSHVATEEKKKYNDTPTAPTTPMSAVSFVFRVRPLCRCWLAWLGLGSWVFSALVFFFVFVFSFVTFLTVFASWTTNHRNKNSTLPGVSSTPPLNGFALARTCTEYFR